MFMDTRYLVLSVIGPQAGEKSDKIFTRKIKDILKVGKTFWVVLSSSAKPDNIHKLCAKAHKHRRNIYCMLIEPSTKNGAEDTKTKQKAKEFSSDSVKWERLPYSKGLSKVTGKITKNTCALVFDEFIFLKYKIDLGNYADFIDKKEPIKIRRGDSTVCAIAKNTQNHPRKMKSNTRSVIAIAKLAKPYAVWLR
jgi:hypothetical protein